MLKSITRFGTNIFTQIKQSILPIKGVEAQNVLSEVSKPILKLSSD